MKNLCVLMAVLIFSACALASTYTFTLTTDGAGNATHSEKVSLGTFRLSSFVAKAAFANCQVKMDGVLAYNAAVVANQSHAASGAAKKTVDFAVTGGPANTSVTVTATYTLGSLESSRGTYTFTLTTDSAGNATDTDTVPFGTFRMSSFVAYGSFSNVQVTADGTVVFNAAVAANKSYAVSSAAKSTVGLAATGGQANASVKVVVTYTLSSPADSRSTYSFTLNTDGSGNASDTDKVPLGTFRMSSFVANGSFANVKVSTDGTVVFDGAVTANQSYAVSGAAKSTVGLVATGGKASAAVTVKVTYTLGSTDADAADFTGEHKVGQWAAACTTDIKGNIREENEMDTEESAVLLLGFKSDMDFANFAAFLDGERIFPCECSNHKGIKAGEVYRMHAKMSPGKHTFAVLGTGGIPSQEVEFIVYYR